MNCRWLRTSDVASSPTHLHVLSPLRDTVTDQPCWDYISRNQDAERHTTSTRRTVPCCGARSSTLFYDAHILSHSTGLHWNHWNHRRLHCYTPFTRSSWLDELLYVSWSWTSQLDVCSMFAWWLLRVGYALCMLHTCSMSARCLFDRVNGVSPLRRVQGDVTELNWHGLVFAEVTNERAGEPIGAPRIGLPRHDAYVTIVT